MERKLISCVGKVMGKDHNNHKRRKPKVLCHESKKNGFSTIAYQGVVDGKNSNQLQKVPNKAPFLQ
jgi:hypothetical protein